MITFSLIIIAFLLVLLNGFFVAAEFAIVKLRGTRLEAIKSEQGLAGQLLVKIHNNLDVYLSACQLGITLASLGLGWIGEPAFARLFEHIFVNHFLAAAFGTFLSFILAFLLIAFLHIVVGELAPKSLAIRKAEKIAVFTAIPLYLFYWVMYPIIWLLNTSSNIILKMVGAGAHDKEHSYSVKELKLILSASHTHPELTKDELQILDRVLDFTDLEVGDLMRPIHEMKAINLGQPIAETLDIITRYHFSRYPIYVLEPHKHIVGVLHTKDLLEYVLQKKGIPEIEKLKRPIIETQLQTPATELFHEFRAGAGHFAVVKNEIGKIVGFITLDDILSVALGSISDEFVKPHRDWFQTKEGSYIMYGHTPIYTLERLLKMEFPNGESNTISGLLLSELDRMPSLNERVHFKKFDVQILKVKGPRIELVKLIPHAPK